MKPGDRVLLNTPDIPRLHGTAAVVVDLQPWGAHVHAPAAETGRFRATWDEMTTGPTTNGKPHRPKAAGMAARDLGYSGDICPLCGSALMRRNGSCLVCDGCGSTTGCS